MNQHDKSAKFPKGKDMTIEQMVAYFEEAGNPEAAAEWRAMHEKYRDEIKDRDEQGSKKARFHEGPEGEREFREWFDDQPEDFQQEWEENTEEYGDKFKTASPEAILDKMMARLAMADRIELKAWAKHAGASPADMVAWIKDRHPAFQPFAEAVRMAHTHLVLPSERFASEQEADKLDAEAEAAEDQAEADRAKADAARMKGASSLGIEAVDPAMFYVTTENGDTYGPYRRERDAWRDAEGFTEATEIETDVDDGDAVLRTVVVPRLFVLKTPAQLRREAGVSRFASDQNADGDLVWLEG